MLPAAPRGCTCRPNCSDWSTSAPRHLLLFPLIHLSLIRRLPALFLPSSISVHSSPEASTKMWLPSLDLDASAPVWSSPSPSLSLPRSSSSLCRRSAAHRARQRTPARRGGHCWYPPPLSLGVLPVAAPDAVRPRHGVPACPMQSVWLHAEVLVATAAVRPPLLPTRPPARCSHNFDFPRPVRSLVLPLSLSISLSILTLCSESACAMECLCDFGAS